MLQITLPVDIEKKVDAYRRNKKLENGGKMMMRHTAVCELLLKALDGVEEVELPTFADLIRRVEALERRHA